MKAQTYAAALLAYGENEHAIRLLKREIRVAERVLCSTPQEDGLVRCPDQQWRRGGPDHEPEQLRWWDRNFDRSRCCAGCRDLIALWERHRGRRARRGGLVRAFLAARDREQRQGAA